MAIEQDKGSVEYKLQCRISYGANTMSSESVNVSAGSDGSAGYSDTIVTLKSGDYTLKVVGTAIIYNPCGRAIGSDHSVS